MMFRLKSQSLAKERSNSFAVAGTPGSQSPGCRARSPPSQPRLHGSCEVAAAATERMAGDLTPGDSEPSNQRRRYQTQF